MGKRISSAVTAVVAMLLSGCAATLDAANDTLDQLKDLSETSREIVEDADDICNIGRSSD